MNLLLTILVAAAGSYLFYKFRIPAGALIGAIIFSAALNIITGVGTFPGFMKTVLQPLPVHLLASVSPGMTWLNCGGHWPRVF